MLRHAAARTRAVLAAAAARVAGPSRSVASEAPASVRSGSSLLAEFARHGDRRAVVDTFGAYTYRHLDGAARRLAGVVATHVAARGDAASGAVYSAATAQPRVALLLPRDHRYVVGQWAAWHAGAIVVPLPEGYPASELRYFLEDAAPSVVLAAGDGVAAVQPVADALRVPVAVVPPLGSLDVVAPSQHGEGAPLAPPAGSVSDTHAMLVYTSGTTSRPKGVLTSHAALHAQMAALLAAWRWQRSDHIYHVLPLHHVHGIMAKMLCAFAAGATVELAPRFDAAATWAALTRPPRHPDATTLFMAVPTVYAKLLAAHAHAPPDVAARWSAALRAPDSPVRLMVSGSAALPAPVMAAWAAATGHRLLERFGMTEFGMALSNPYDGPRVPSSVGTPLPGYEARLVGDGGGVVTAAGVSGELQVRGAAMFTEYWRKPDATAAAFAPGGWFATGDSAHTDAHGAYYIDGRLSADIIKAGGFKISALEIERTLLEHAGVAEVAVFGVPDATYGERVVALVVAAAHPPDAHFSDALARWARTKLPHYKVPAAMRLVDAIPRNAMGKVNKKELRAAWLASPATPHAPPGSA